MDLPSLYESLSHNLLRPCRFLPHQLWVPVLVPQRWARAGSSSQGLALKRQHQWCWKLTPWL